MNKNKYINKNTSYNKNNKNNKNSKSPKKQNEKFPKYQPKQNPVGVGSPRGPKGPFRLPGHFGSLRAPPQTFLKQKQKRQGPPKRQQKQKQNYKNPKVKLLTDLHQFQK